MLGIWWQETEGAKFWLAVLNDLHRRGVDDVLIACVDGLKGFPEAIEATFPQAWVQTCIVHLIRASLRYVNYRDRKKVAAALRPIYTAANADAALDRARALRRASGARATRRPSQAWRAAWEHVIPFLALPDELRRAVYTTNTHRGPAPPDPQGDQDPRTLPRRTGRDQAHLPRASSRPTPSGNATAPGQRARAALKIHFGDRFPG